MRIGQCWEVQGKAVEILGFRGDEIKIMAWESEQAVKIGDKMHVKEDNRPKGIGGSTLMKKSVLTCEATHLLELSVDEVTEGGEGELICEVMARRRNKAVERRVKIPGYLCREWARWDGGNFTHTSSRTDPTRRKLHGGNSSSVMLKSRQVGQLYYLMV